MAAPNDPPQFDPLHFPNYTPESLESNISLLIFGMAIYEGGTSVQLLAAAFTPTRMKSPIFFMITASVISLVVAHFFQLMLTFNLTSADPFMGAAEFGINCAALGFLLFGRLAYFVAGTLRSRALLTMFPKILYCLYFALFVCVLLDAANFALVAAFWEYMRSTPPQFFPPEFPYIPIFNACITLQNITNAFETVVTNALMMSFLYPIFSAINLEPGAALKEMISLKDVRKALYALSLVFLYIGFNKASPYPYLANATLYLWLHTQNSQFLRLSYVSTAELISKHSVGITGKPSTGKHTDISNKA